MKRALLYGPLVLCLTFPLLNIQAQSMSHEEEVVRNAYAKFSLLCSLPPVTHAATNQLAGVKVDLLQLETKVANATPVFDLSDFQTGSVASIANEIWGTFVTPPQQGGNVIDGQLEQQGYEDNGNGTTWQMANARWMPSPQITPDGENTLLSKAVSEMIKLGSPQWQPANMPLVTYTRYAEFTVNATFQGKSTGPHKAIFFFGTDAKGKEFVAGNDLISGSGVLNFIANDPGQTDPSGLLMNKLRESPIMADWLRANIVTESACSSTQALCCSHGRCGISSTAFNNALATPLPLPKD
jgi:hypothetical protein